jgi:tRNA G18 (ribose-2'-O)-methylase SpoU
MSNELIRGDLNERRRNFSVLVWNLGIDFNISSCLRSNNAMLGRHFFIYGKRRFDRRGAVGCQNYENLKHVSEVDGVTGVSRTLPDDTVWIAVDNVLGATSIGPFVWPKDRHVLMCFGSEGEGLPKEILDRCDYRIYIPMPGSVRSINVAAAATVAFYDYSIKTGVLGDT